MQNNLLKCKTPVSSPSDDDTRLEHAGIHQMFENIGLCRKPSHYTHFMSSITVNFAIEIIEISFKCSQIDVV